MHPRQARLIRSALGFIFFFVFIPPFAFIGDRPSRVFDPEDEGFFARIGQWISTAFHVVLPLVVLVTFGVWGFALLPLTVLIVARRLSASKGVPYFQKDLIGDITELLESRRLQNIVIFGTAVALILSLTTMFGLPTNFFSAVASAFIWGTWLYLAGKASAMNVKAAVDEQITRATFAQLLSNAFSAPLAAWDNSQIVNEGLQLIVTPPPAAAIMHYAQADAILASIAPQWELAPESDHEQLILNEVSEETIQRRAEEARSGGLIAGKLSDAATPNTAPAFAGVTITADDLF
jgi:hypothetical protein